MAKRFLDQGAYGTYAAYATSHVPNVWGKPLDGDGLAKEPSTAVGLAKITFSAVPTVGSSPNITVLGVALTTLTTLTSAASESAAATALANLINASTATVPASVNSVGSGTAWGSTHQLRNMVYARAVDSSCEVMMRVGSARLNYDNNVICCITSANVNNISSTATEQRFAGGVSGCYGWLFNDQASFLPSALASTNYGLFCQNAPLAGVPAPADVVVVRSKKDIMIPGNGYAMRAPAMGLLNEPVVILFDDGTEWTEDAPEPQFFIRSALTGNAVYAQHFFGENGYTRNVILKAPVYSDTKRGLCIHTSNPSSGNSWLNLMTDTATIEGVELYAGGVAAAYLGSAFAGTGSYHTMTFRKILVRREQVNSMRGFVDFNVNTDLRCEIIDCEFKHDNATVGVNPLIRWTNYARLHRIHFERLKVTGLMEGGVTNHLFPAGAVNNVASVTFSDCDLGAITFFGPYHVSPNGYLAQDPRSNPIMYLSTNKGKRDFAVESSRGFFEWNPRRNFPTLNAKLDDAGATPWSIHAFPVGVRGDGNLLISRLNPLEAPPLTFVSTQPSGIKTFTMEIGLEQGMLQAGASGAGTLPWDSRDVTMQVSYTDTTGTERIEDTFDPYGAPLTTSNAAWSRVVAGEPADGTGPSFEFVDQDNQYVTLKKRKLVLTTKFPVAIGTKIRIVFQVRRISYNSLQHLFYCPQVLMV